MEWIEKEVNISEVQTLIDEGYEVEVDSPDGWVGVNFFINKGDYEEYVLQLDDSSVEPVRCNAQHLFETATGWASAQQLIDKGSANFLTKNGYKAGEVKKTGNVIPIVDINVNHDNHRYYTQGISSHNTGVGKSLAMCHFASSMLSQGKNVLYITMEMAEERIAERIDANLFDVNIADLSTLSRQEFDNKVNTIQSSTNGRLIVKEYPTAQAHVGHFRSLLNELKLKKEFEPDCIFVDYLNICASSRMKGIGGAINSYSYVKAIAEEIRGLAVEFDLPIWTATQTNREGFANSDVDLTNTSESFGLPATADLMLALISTEELEEMDQVMVKQLKNRYNDPTYYRKFVLGIDRAKMRLYDTDDSAQDDIAPEMNEFATQISNDSDFSSFTVN